MVKRAKPVTPEAIVKSPNEPGVSAAAVDKIPLTATTTVTTDAPAVLSMYRSNEVPWVALKAAPNKVPVGSVMDVVEAEVAERDGFRASGHHRNILVDNDRHTEESTGRSRRKIVQEDRSILIID